jgi:hypothetical protein
MAVAAIDATPCVASSLDPTLLTPTLPSTSLSLPALTRPHLPLIFANAPHSINCLFNTEKVEPLRSPTYSSIAQQASTVDRLLNTTYPEQAVPAQQSQLLHLTTVDGAYRDDVGLITG